MDDCFDNNEISESIFESIIVSIETNDRIYELYNEEYDSFNDIKITNELVNNIKSKKDIIFFLNSFICDFNKIQKLNFKDIRKIIIEKILDETFLNHFETKNNIIQDNEINFFDDNLKIVPKNLESNVEKEKIIIDLKNKKVVKESYLHEEHDRYEVYKALLERKKIGVKVNIINDDVIMGLRVGDKLNYIYVNDPYREILNSNNEWSLCTKLSAIMLYNSKNILIGYMEDMIAITLVNMLDVFDLQNIVVHAISSNDIFYGDYVPEKTIYISFKLVKKNEKEISIVNHEANLESNMIFHDNLEIDKKGSRYEDIGYSYFYDSLIKYLNENKDKGIRLINNNYQFCIDAIKNSSEKEKVTLYKTNDSYDNEFDSGDVVVYNEKDQIIGCIEKSVADSLSILMDEYIIIKNAYINSINKKKEGYEVFVNFDIEKPKDDLGN